MTHGEALSCLDAGCGEGYYLAYIRQKLAQQCSNVRVNAYGVDISKPAIIAATKRDRNIAWIVASNKQLPFMAQSINAVLCMFGFPNFAGFKKVIKPGAAVILVDPNPDHLFQLRNILYEDVSKKASLSHDKALRQGFSLVAEHRVDFMSYLDSQQQIMDLTYMTPHYFKATHDAREKLEHLTRLDLSVDVCIKVFRL